MGLFYFGARYYDPDVGLWTSTDPKEQFYSLYSYTGNGFNPIGGIDRDGLDFMKTTWFYSKLRGKNWAFGLTEYFGGTPNKPGDKLGQWVSHSGGNGTPLESGKHTVSTSMIDVSHKEGFKTWAFLITSKGKGPGGRFLFRV